MVLRTFRWFAAAMRIIARAELARR